MLFPCEYTSREDSNFSETNNLIRNFKKGVDRRNYGEWRYKERAINSIANSFHDSLGFIDSDVTFIPIPPSKAKNDPLYDDRLSKMLRSIKSEHPLDVRDLIIQIESTEAAHDRDDRPNPDQIKELYKIDEDLTDPTPKMIAVVDDVLTTGAHFKASKLLLSNRFSDVSIIGLFVARRVFVDNVINDFEEIEESGQDHSR